jgi:hypothetical protein
MKWITLFLLAWLLFGTDTGRTLIAFFVLFAILVYLL